MRAILGVLALLAGVASACSDPLRPSAGLLLTRIGYTSIVSGGSHTCALTADGAAYCWGDATVNGEGGLGDGSTDSSAVPVAVSRGLTFSTLVAQFAETCGFAAGGTGYCWGARGDSLRSSSSVPTPLPGGLTVEALVIGFLHTCALTTRGAAYCWGWNTSGQLGDGSTNFSAVPVAVTGGLEFSSLTAGAFHTCGLAVNGSAYCWGDARVSGEGGLGDGLSTFSPIPVAVSGGHTFSVLDAGASYTCGITTGGVAYCWGWNGTGVLGDGSTNPSLVPVAVSGGLTVSALSAGGGHTCGLTTSGEAWCWGSNGMGQLGTGSTIVQSWVPVPVTGGLTFSELSAGAAHTCGLTVGSLVYCWGENASGQLGDGAPGVDSNVPIKVAGQP